MMDLLKKWEADGMKMAAIGVTVSFTFTLRKRITLAETLDRMSEFEVDLEFQQVCNLPTFFMQHLSVSPCRQRMKYWKA